MNNKPADWSIDALVEACSALRQERPEVALHVIRQALWSHTGDDGLGAPGGKAPSHSTTPLEEAQSFLEEAAEWCSLEDVSASLKKLKMNPERAAERRALASLGRELRKLAVVGSLRTISEMSRLADKCLKALKGEEDD